MTHYPDLPGYPSKADVIVAPGEKQNYRPFITAKGYRALGYPIPAHIPDDTVVDLVIEGAS